MTRLLLLKLNISRWDCNHTFIFHLQSCFLCRVSFKHICRPSSCSPSGPIIHILPVTGQAARVLQLSRFRPFLRPHPWQYRVKIPISSPSLVPKHSSPGFSKSYRRNWICHSSDPDQHGEWHCFPGRDNEVSSSPSPLNSKSTPCTTVQALESSRARDELWAWYLASVEEILEFRHHLLPLLLPLSRHVNIYNVSDALVVLFTGPRE